MKYSAGVLTWAETHSINAQGERHDGDAGATRGIRHICGKQGVAEKPGILAMDMNNAGNLTTYYLWVDSAGKLRIGTAIPADENAEGTVVGAQEA